MTEQEFIDYMAPYGTHVEFVYGNDIIQKKIHLTPYNSDGSYFPHKSNGRDYYMKFIINDKEATIKECVDLITSYNRDKKLNEIGIL